MINTVQSKNRIQTIKTIDPFPLNKGRYSFSVIFEEILTKNYKIGDVFDGLNFVGICSDKFDQFNQYILYSRRAHIYGFGDDMKSRGWITWRYFGDGKQPQAWWSVTKEKGGFGHKGIYHIFIIINI